MTWADLDPEQHRLSDWPDPEFGAVAEEVCNENELQVLRYSEKHWGYRRIAEWLDITSWETVRDRVKRGRKKVAKRQEQIREEREAA